MGRRRKSAIGETCVNCKKVPEGEFCTERCLNIPKSGDPVTDAMIKYQVTHPIHPYSIADQIEVRNPNAIFKAPENSIKVICGCNGTGKLPGSPPWLNIRCTCNIGRKNLTDRLGNKISKN